MSTPSPEPKQAEEEDFNIILDAVRDLFNCTQQGTYSAEQYRNAQAAVKRTLAATAKLREELELAWGIIANAHGGDWDKESKKWQDAAIRWRDRYFASLPRVSQSASEQLNVHTPPLAHQQPSATTPEVKKIAQETVHDCGGYSTTQLKEKRIIKAIAQARDPLVEALRDIRATGDSSQALKAWQKCLQIADAALTGTEEKR